MRPRTFVRVLRALPRMDNVAFAALAARLPMSTFRKIERRRPVWIFGAGGFGQDLAIVMQHQGFEVAGFVETKPGRKTALNLEVVDWNVLAQRDRGAQLAFGIFNHRQPFEQTARIAVDAGFSEPVMPWELYDQFGEGLGWRFWLSQRDFLVRNLGRVAQVAARLADDTSREVLFRTCAFRLGLDPAYSSYLSGERQYFNEISLPGLLGRRITYLDCGAYNGDTFADLVSRAGVNCGQAFLLEPDPANFSQLVSALGERRSDVVCLPLAAAETYGILTFSSAGTSSAIGAGGDVHIAAVAVDELLPGAALDLMKIDVEGAEAQVLRGARKIIARSRPVLALSLYHNPQDPWELPELLFELCPDYRFHIRQHSFNSFELVLYAIPETP
jgi:FkbM family methyltransferase